MELNWIAGFLLEHFTSSEPVLWKKLWNGMNKKSKILNIQYTTSQKKWEKNALHDADSIY